MQTITGDLIALAQAGRFDVIVHGCNCFHAMGAGIARSIAASFPAALAADQATAYGSRDKLGTLSQAEVRCGSHRLIIVNAYTQFDWKFDGKSPGPLVDYSAVERCFQTIAARYRDARIGYPKIGAGLAGGDWAVLAPIIDRALDGSDHTLVVLPK